MIRSIISLLFCLFFGIVCFLGGIIYSNFLTGERQRTEEARGGERQNKFFEVGDKILENRHILSQAIEGLSKFWNQAIEYGSDVAVNVKTYFEKTKDRLETYKNTDNQ